MISLLTSRPSLKPTTLRLNTHESREQTLGIRAHFPDHMTGKSDLSEDSAISNKIAKNLGVTRKIAYPVAHKVLIIH